MKSIIVMALFLAPFFSVFLHAQQQDNNIFSNGTVILKEPLIDSQETYLCVFNNKDMGRVSSLSSCLSKQNQYFNDTVTGNCGSHLQNVNQISETGYSFKIVTKYMDYPENGVPYCRSYISGTRYATISNKEQTEIVKCPHPTTPTYFYPVDTDDDGLPNFCADPVQVNLVDSCNTSSGNEYLTIAVDADKSQICHTQSDGSVCQYNATDIGQGKSYYALDLEGDCYTEPKPDVVGDEMPDPQDGKCVDYGNGTLGCPEDPQNVCRDSGSTVGQGSIKNCNVGCGYVNDQFLCIDTDLDGDELPDYNDPDIDGDGIPNDTDLDSDGDGKDDPINGDGDTPVKTGGGASIDLAPVVKKLSDIEGELKKKLTKPSEKGTFDLDAAQALVDAKKQEYQQKLTQIKSEASTLVGNVVANTGSFGAQYNIPTLNGKTKNVTTTQYSDEMRLLALAILFLFTLAAGFIVLGGLGGKK